jgi:uncharacterized membrane protein YjgN (DUF898 family)
MSFCKYGIPRIGASVRRNSSIKVNHALALLLALGVLSVGAMGTAQVVAATLDIAVSNSSDDAEEQLSASIQGRMGLTSADLEMPWDGSKQ